MASKKTEETKVKKPTVKTETAEKKVAKAPVKVAVEKTEKKVTVKKESTLKIDVYDVSGKVAETISLPEEIFGEKLNKTLLAQAVRVYRANKRQGNASTKTRGEVDGSTAKIYRQKGTGRARHGSKRAPIFVHGGIVHGPKPRDFSMDFPKKMRRKALFVALSAKLRDGEIKIISGLEKLEPKTKQFVGAITKVGVSEEKRKLLFVTAQDATGVKRAARNVEGVVVTAAARLNAYDVLAKKELLIMKDALADLSKAFLKKE
jgi:large subunit ribosomal protein L4